MSSKNTALKTGFGVAILAALAAAAGALVMSRRKNLAPAGAAPIMAGE